jgi:hypothetical protein
MTKKTVETGEAEMTEEVSVVKPVKANKFQKVKELSNLSDSLENAKLQTFVTGLPSGDKIWELLTSAISKEIDGAMGDPEALNSAAESLSQSLKNLGQLATGLASLASSVNAMSAQIGHINNSEVIRALGMVVARKQGLPTPQQGVVPQNTQPQHVQEASQSTLPPIGSPNATVENSW